MAHPHFAPRALIGWLAALVLCLAVFVAFAKPGPWFSRASGLRIAPQSLQLARGAGAMANGALVVTGTAQDGNAVVSVATNLSARDYARVAWRVRDLPAGVEAALLWNTDVEPDRVNRMPLTVTGGTLQPANVASDPHWLGHIRGLALVLHGTLEAPVAVLGGQVSTGDALDTLRSSAREWFGFGPWDGTSINTVPGGAETQRLPLPLLLFGALLVVAAALVARAVIRRRTGTGEALTHDASARTVLLVFLVSWFVLDARWQVTLARHVHDDGQRFSGKTAAEKHLALDDGALFAFIEKVRAILPPVEPDALGANVGATARAVDHPGSTLPARVFVLADSNYLRGRAAYHLYPWNVWSDATRNVVPPADRLHRGDWIVVYQRRGVEYDAATHHLRWDGGKVLNADLKLLDHGGALFELR